MLQSCASGTDNSLLVAVLHLPKGGLAVWRVACIHCRNPLLSVSGVHIGMTTSPEIAFGHILAHLACCRLPQTTVHSLTLMTNSKPDCSVRSVTYAPAFDPTCIHGGSKSWWRWRRGKLYPTTCHSSWVQLWRRLFAPKLLRRQPGKVRIHVGGRGGNG